MQGSEVVLPIVTIPGQTPQPLPPVTLPYSAEYNPQPAGKGIEILQTIAAMTGGTVRLRLDGIWKTLPPRITYRDLQPWLLLISILLFLFEIIIRRGALPKRFQPENHPLETPRPAPTSSAHPSNPITAPLPTEEPDTTQRSSALKKAASRSKERLQR